MKNLFYCYLWNLYYSVFPGATLNTFTVCLHLAHVHVYHEIVLLHLICMLGCLFVAYVQIKYTYCNNAPYLRVNVFKAEKGAYCVFDTLTVRRSAF